MKTPEWFPARRDLQKSRFIPISVQSPSSLKARHINTHADGTLVGVATMRQIVYFVFPDVIHPGMGADIRSLSCLFRARALPPRDCENRDSAPSFPSRLLQRRLPAADFRRRSEYLRTTGMDGTQILPVFKEMLFDDIHERSIRIACLE